MGGVAVNASDSLQKFDKGSRVEVIYDDPEDSICFRWREARIIDPDPKEEPNKLYVEYPHIIDNKDGSMLKRYVDWEDVRPCPPSEHYNIECFELNAVVDAFWYEEWWSGVITKVVVGNSMFVVSFENVNQIEFGASRLRVHREWVNGKWIQPPSQRKTGLMLAKRKVRTVEVSFENEAYRDVWIPATVLEERENGSFLVKCFHSNINGVSKCMKVVVDVLNIRPPPIPVIEFGKKFVLSEKVDAWIDFCWWSGVITQEFSNGWYTVFLESTKKETKVSRYLVRAHIEWKDGKWFSESPDALTLSDKEEHFTNGSLGDLRDTEVAGSRTYKKLKEANLTEVPWDLWILNTTAMDTTPRENRYSGFVSSTNKDARANSSDQPMEGNQVEGTGENISKRKRRRPCKFTVKSPDASAAGNQQNGGVSAKDRNMPGKEDQSLPFVKDNPVVWKAIEANEAFQKFPQKPHFRSLESSKENTREGLAIGFMVVFTSIVKKISSLKFDDPRAKIEDHLETLLELENNGFEVKKLRERLTKLLLMKDKQEELQDQSKSKKCKIGESNKDRSKFNEKINGIDEEITVLQEERKLAIAYKEKKDAEIAGLELAVEGINNEMRSVQCQFGALVAAPWVLSQYKRRVSINSPRGYD